MSLSFERRETFLGIRSCLYRQACYKTTHANLRRLMGDSPLLPVVSADPIAPPGLRPRFPATHPVWDIFADLLWVTARNDTGDTDDTDDTNSTSDMDTDTWASYKLSYSPRSSDEFESRAGYLMLILSHARHTGECFHVPFVVGVLMIHCNAQRMISAERETWFSPLMRDILASAFL